MRPRFRKRHGGESTDVTAPGEAGAEGGGPSFDDLLAQQLHQGVDETAIEEDRAAPEDRGDRDEDDPPVSGPAVEPPADLAVEPRTDGAVEPPCGDFWEGHERASAEAAMAAIPPASVIAVVGPLEAAAPVIERCRDQHWMGSACDVYVLTQRREVDEHHRWTVVGQPSDLVSVLESGRSDFPVLVLDVPCDLPAFVRPLIGRLRESGVGLVHYVLDGDPDDEDLATWHGELGRPSVLDLAAAVQPARVLELLDRGEPVVSVAGMPLTAELLLAFRADDCPSNPVHAAATAI